MSHRLDQQMKNRRTQEDGFHIVCLCQDMGEEMSPELWHIQTKAEHKNCWNIAIENCTVELFKKQLKTAWLPSKTSIVESMYSATGWGTPSSPFNVQVHWQITLYIKEHNLHHFKKWLKCSIVNLTQKGVDCTEWFRHLSHSKSMTMLQTEG